MLPRCLMGIADLTLHASNFLCGADSLLHFFLFYVENSASVKYVWILSPAELILYPDCLLSEAPAFGLLLIVHAINHAPLYSQEFSICT